MAGLARRGWSGAAFEEMTSGNDRSGVIVPPPILWLATWTAARAMQRIVHLEISEDNRKLRFVHLGQMLVYTGLAIFRNRLWPLILLPAALALVTNAVIEREERYLDRRFGAAYREYMKRVPRWL